MNECTCVCCQARQDDRDTIFSLQLQLREQNIQLMAEGGRVMEAERRANKAESWCRRLVDEKHQADVTLEQKVSDQRKLQHFEIFKAAITGAAVPIGRPFENLVSNAKSIADVAMKHFP